MSQILHLGLHLRLVEAERFFSAGLHLALDTVMQPLDRVGAEVGALVVALEAEIGENIRTQLIVDPRGCRR